jgi:DNA-binding PadR family transcriptional regulator
MGARASSDGLTTTSYAILGLLSIKSWTTYELAREMEHGLGKFWPRARSLLFKEPQKLVGLGLAAGKRQHVGRRARTVYSITPKGRRALARWLKQPGAGPVLEWEQLAQMFFAGAGTKEDVVRTLTAVREWSAERMRYQRAKARSYLDGEGAFPDRVAITALTGGFLAEFEALVGDWAKRSLAIVEGWPDDVSKAEPDWPTVERVAAMAEETYRALNRPASGRGSPPSTR